jgi:hypothetical protein
MVRSGSKHGNSARQQHVCSIRQSTGTAAAAAAAALCLRWFHLQAVRHCSPPTETPHTTRTKLSTDAAPAQHDGRGSCILRALRPEQQQHPDVCCTKGLQAALTLLRQ